MATISNGKNVPINVRTGTVPNMSGALLNWFQPLLFARVTKETIDFQVVETMEPINFRGVIMPMEGRQIEIKSEGERYWNGILVFSDTSLQLRPDDVIKFLGTQYRVLGQKNYAIYGYLEYTLVSDWTGSGPEEETP